MRFKASPSKSWSPDSMKPQFRVPELHSSNPYTEFNTYPSQPINMMYTGHFAQQQQPQQPKSPNTVFVNYSPSPSSIPIDKDPKMLRFSNPSRSVSAPVARQDPTVLRELAGMMGNTVSFSSQGGGSLSLAAPNPSPPTVRTKSDIDISPINPFSRPSPVQVHKPSPIQLPPRSNEISSFDSNNTLPSSNRRQPTIGGGAFKKIKQDDNNR